MNSHIDPKRVVDKQGQDLFTYDNTAKVESSAQKAYAVAPSDSTDLPNGITKGLYVGTTGDVVAVFAGDTEIKLTGLASGVFHPISVKQVKATGTTATSIVAVY
jgi:hypothetical protein